MADDLRARFERLARPIPPDKIQWRQDGRPVSKGTKWFARFVAYIDARFVQQRLDEEFCGDWSLEQTLLPERGDEDGVAEVSMKARLTILGLWRECVGSGSTYKNAASDAFKRAAVRFGVASDLYDLDVNWVEVDGDSKFSKPVEDPALAYERRAKRSEQGRGGQAAPAPRAAVGEAPPSPAPAAAKPRGRAKIAPVPCPVCKADMWDNRETRTGNQPDYKCVNACSREGAVWLTEVERKRLADGLTPEAAQAKVDAGFPHQLLDEQDDLPF